MMHCDQRNQAVLHYWCVWENANTDTFNWQPAISVPHRQVIEFLRAIRPDQRDWIESILEWEGKGAYVKYSDTREKMKTIVPAPGMRGYVDHNHDPRAVPGDDLLRPIVLAPQVNKEAYAMFHVQCNLLIASALRIAMKMQRSLRRNQRQRARV